jgi:hypothetical protein
MEASFIIKNWQKSFPWTWQQRYFIWFGKSQKTGGRQITPNYFTSYLFHNMNRSMKFAPLPYPRGGAVLLKVLF